MWLARTGGSILSALLLCTALWGCSMTGWSNFGEIETGTGSTEPSESAVDSTEVVVYWTPPIDGSPVVYYETDWAHGQYDRTPKNKQRFTIPDSIRTRVRVRGVDAQERRGAYSEWSNWWPSRDAAGDTIDIHDPPIDQDDNGRRRR